MAKTEKYGVIFKRGKMVIFYATGSGLGHPS